MQDRLDELVKLAKERQNFFYSSLPRVNGGEEQINVLTEQDEKREVGGGKEKKKDFKINEEKKRCQCEEKMEAKNDEEDEEDENEDDVERQLLLKDVDSEEEGGPKTLSEYLEKVSAIKYEICRIEKANSSILSLKNCIAHSSNVDKEKQICEEANKTFDEVCILVLKIKKELNCMKEKNEKVLKKNGMSSELKIKMNLEEVLQKKLFDTLKILQKTYREFNQQIKQQMFRQARLINRDVSREDIDDIVDCGISSSEFLMGKLSDQGGANAKSTISDLRDKLRQIKKLQKTIKDIQNAYMEISMLVEKNQTVIQNIDQSVFLTKNVTEKAKDDLFAAKKYKEAARRRMFWISLFLLILAIVVLLPIITFLFAITK